MDAKVASQMRELEELYRQKVASLEVQRNEWEGRAVQAEGSLALALQSSNQRKRQAEEETKTREPEDDRVSKGGDRAD